MTSNHVPVSRRRLPSLRQTLAAAAVVVLAAALVGASLMPASHANVMAIRMQQVEGLTDVGQICEPGWIRRMIGPPMDEAQEIDSAIFGLSVQIDFTSSDKGNMRLLLGLFSYMEESQRLLPEYIALVQRQLSLSPGQIVKRNIQPCAPYFSASQSAKTSRAHTGLLRITRGLFSASAEPIVLASFSIVRADDAVSSVRPPAGKAPAEREPSAALPEDRGSRPPGKSAAIEPKKSPAPSTAPAPKSAEPPPKASVPSPKAIEAPPKRVEGGCDLDCMLEAEKRAKATRSPDAKSGDKSAAASPWSPSVRTPSDPPETSVPAVPPTVIERPMPKAPASGKSDATSPSDVPKASLATKLKRYPSPNYPTLAEPLSIAPGSPRPDTAGLPAADGSARTVFGVESVECSDEGNWIVGYFGFLTSKPDGTGQFSIRQRYAINNYPDEGVTMLSELQRHTKQFECSGAIDCKAPRRTIPYAEFLRSRHPASTSETTTVVVPKDKGIEWRCRPEKGICLSRETDHWRCEAGKEPAAARCLSYDPARWWCVPRREFCYQTVPFGDWGSPHKEGSVVTIQLQTKKDASGRTIDQDHVYDMSHGILGIAQDVLMRQCSRHSGPAKEWKASWFNQTAN